MFVRLGCRLVVPVVLALVWSPQLARGYGVGPAVPLEKLASQVDLVCKATATADKPVADAWFRKLPGYAPRATTFQVVSCLKGTPPKTFAFHHYAPAPYNGGIGYSPLYYEIDVGKTYVVFASAVPRRRGVYRQWAQSHTQKPNQGLMRTADARPLTGPTVTAAVRAELVKMIGSQVADDVVTGIEELDALSGGRRSNLTDLERPGVLADLRPLILSKDDAIASAAIGVFGADSPYFDDQQVQSWLAGVGPGKIAGYTRRRLPVTGAAASATNELIAIASSPSKLRSLAIRALGRTRTLPAGTLLKWSRDADAAVRAATVLISSELPDRSVIAAGARDAAPEVRRSAALAVGFSQDPKLLSILDKLLVDPAGPVRAAAAMSTLTFGPVRARALMTAHLRGDYKPLFVNALAEANPKPYLAVLGEVIEKHLQPTVWWGGRIPAADSWDLVFEYVKSRPAAELASGTLDAALDSLEKMDWFSSSQPRDLYALYIRRNLPARAKQFRTMLQARFASLVSVQYLDEAASHPERFVP